MEQAKHFPQGNYRYAKRMKQYSGGVAADDGYAIKRVRFRTVVPMAEGWQHAKRIIEADGRPLTSLCSVELRSPEPFSEQGFRDFNDMYLEVLEDWGIYKEGGDNPVARVNVCPIIHPPKTPSFFAFCYTVPVDGAKGDYILAGTSEAPETGGDYKDNIIAYGDTSESGMLKKGKWVFEELDRRLKVLGGSWDNITDIQLYTIHPVHNIIKNVISNRGDALNQGIMWNYSRPPVVGMEMEGECRRVWDEQLIDS